MREYVRRARGAASRFGVLHETRSSSGDQLRASRDPPGFVQDLRASLDPSRGKIDTDCADTE
jgi:hypothetical protein